MDMTLLTEMGIPPKIVQQWQAELGPHLLPVQVKAVCKHGLLDRNNLIVFAPTSSGKTFIGEIATIHAVEHRRKVFYLLSAQSDCAREI